MARKADHQLIHSSKTPEWYTPRRYIDAVYAVMGSIDLDPASTAEANETIQATQYYTEADDGLSKPWVAKTLFLNPPYGKVRGQSNQGRWSQKLIAEYEAGRVREAILLVNAATGDQWFQPLWRYPICFVNHRIHFIKPLATKKEGPTHCNAFIYFGCNAGHFDVVFRQLGIVVLPPQRGATTHYQSRGTA